MIPQLKYLFFSFKIPAFDSPAQGGLTMKCPICELERNPDHSKCPECGIEFAKYDKKISRARTEKKLNATPAQDSVRKKQEPGRYKEVIRMDK